MWLKIYIVYFIIKNTLKIFLLIYLKKKGMSVKKIILIIKNKRRKCNDQMFYS